MASVVVLTQEIDATADVVIEELNRRGVSVARFDLNGVSVAAEMVGPRWVGQLRTATRTVRLEDATGIYYRRPSPPRAPTGTDPQVSRWVEAETRWGMRGLLSALPRARWLNWPLAVDAAEHKPWQLTEAAEAGLRLPPTMVTDVPEAAARFARAAGPVLYKAFRNQPVRIDGKNYLTYATAVEPEQCLAESVRTAPIMLQTRIDKRYDARVTCVDGHVFAVRPIRADGSTPLDWRTDHNANQWRIVDIPDTVRADLLRLLDRIKLRFAACDFSVDQSGAWWFLEANPTGQWAWDHPLRTNIAEAIADALTRDDPS